MSIKNWAISMKLPLLLVVVTLLCLTGCDSSKTTTLIHVPPEDTEVVVDVNAALDGWRFTLTYDDYTVDNINDTIYLPKGELIRFSTHSSDKIHSLRFNDTKLKSVDVIPGYNRQQNVSFESVADIELSCAEYHPTSEGTLLKLKVVEKPDFEEWVRNNSIKSQAVNQ